MLEELLGYAIEIGCIVYGAFDIISRFHDFD